MTDRVKGLMVALETDIRVDDVEAIRVAISQIRGVAAVSVVISNSDDWMNRQQILHQIRGRFLEFWKSIDKP